MRYPCGGSCAGLRCFAGAALAWLVVGAGLPALAQPLPLHPGTGGPTAAPSFGEAVAAAWARYPQRRTFAARQQEAAARYAAGGAFFPNAPAATGSYVNDKVAGSNLNYITGQVEFSTPVWLPGQGTATQALARADTDAIAAEADAAHLALAAQVLDLAARAAQALNARDAALRRATAAQALAADLARRFRVGESSESDSLASSADAAAARVALSGAEAELGAARAALAAVTGTDAVPRLAVTSFPPPSPSARPASPPAVQVPPGLAPAEAAALAGHPRVVAAGRAVISAQANARLVRIDSRDSPEVGLQGINEKQPGSRWDTRGGVVFRFPFATEARNAPRRAAAEQALTQAEVQLELVRRDVLAGLRQAAAALSGAERAAPAAERAAGELERRRGQLERAWRLGEMSLIEVVRANALAYDAALARSRAQTELAAARLRLRLAEGSLP